MANRSSRIIIVALWAALMLSSVAIVRIGLWQAAVPQPVDLESGVIKSLQSAGWEIRNRKPLAARGSEVSWAEGVELINTRQYTNTRIELIPVRARGPHSFNIETLVRPVLGKKNWKIRLTEFDGNQRAELKNSEAITKQDTVEAACWINGVTGAQRKQLLKLKLQGEQIKGIQQELERLIGLRQTREWDCLLIVLRTSSGGNQAKIWAEVVEKLTNHRRP
jgi:hypothetical protein